MSLQPLQALALHLLFALSASRLVQSAFSLIGLLQYAELVNV